jgi:GT2 family glycosyltransferase
MNSEGCVETTLARANRLFREGRYEEALQAYEAAMAERPEIFPIIRFNMTIAEKKKSRITGCQLPNEPQLLEKSKRPAVHSSILDSFEFHGQQEVLTEDSSTMATVDEGLGFRPARYSEEFFQLLKATQVSDSHCVDAKGHIEIAAADKYTKQGVVVGWEFHAPNTFVWIEDETGAIHPLDSGYSRFRKDVYDAFIDEFGYAENAAGFIVRIPMIEPGAKVFLKAYIGDRVHLLAQATCDKLPADPVAVARWLLGIECSRTDFYRRVECVDEPLISALIHHRQSKWGDLPVQIRRLGEVVAQPRVSIIIPLYGRTDFVEHQLIEFCHDGWLKSNAEIIYVVDDPKLVEPFTIDAQALYRLYRHPFTWVWGSVNRGFSGANNLGAAYARGDYLIFLNSDVFPQGPAWVQHLIAVLEKKPNVGIVGPRLVFANGGIQHAGMQFMRLDELGLWVNHHPYMGLDPALDPAKDLTFVPAVTGACMALRKRDFEDLGGWDTGYLIGDFEDSDLCFKFRDAGLKIAYLPTVQLTHLERQSFKLLGGDDFRQWVTLYNAARHQKRWRHLIEASVF